MSRNLICNPSYAVTSYIFLTYLTHVAPHHNAKLKGRKQNNYSFLLISPHFTHLFIQKSYVGLQFSHR